MQKEKQMCSEDGCYMMVDLFFAEKYSDGRLHPLAEKCHKCQTSEDLKKLKRFRKKVRYRNNKKKRLNGFIIKGSC